MKKEETTSSPTATTKAATKEDQRRTRSLSPRKLVGSFRKSKTEGQPSAPSSSTKQVVMSDTPMTTADGKSSYLAYLEANHKASAAGSKKTKRSSSRSRSRSRSRSQRQQPTSEEKTKTKPQRRSLSPRRKSNRIYAKPSPSSTIDKKKDLPPADTQQKSMAKEEAKSSPTASSPSVAPKVGVDRKSEYLAFLEANNKMGSSSGKKKSSSTGGGGGSKRNLFRSKSNSKRLSKRSVPVQEETVYVETKDVKVYATKKDKVCDESEPAKDDSFVEPEELKDMAIVDVDTPVLSNIAEAATDDETASLPSASAQVEQEETELTAKSGFFDSLLDCTSMGFCLSSSTKA